MINYDDSRRDVSIETTPGLRTQSRLIIREPQISDSGNYTCSASNTEPASIYVFVSKGRLELALYFIESERVYFAGQLNDHLESRLHKTPLPTLPPSLMYEINSLILPRATPATFKSNKNFL
jgi:hypothetical protein